MDRRDFLKTTGTLIAGATVASGVPGAGYSAEPAPAAPGRMVLPINRNWRFSPKATPAARARDFDDSGFTRVTVPHTSIREPWHSFDENSYEFVSLYRRRFRLPAAGPRRRRSRKRESPYESCKRRSVRDSQRNQGRRISAARRNNESRFCFSLPK